MNTARIKVYAPQARRESIQAVTDKAGLLGLSRDHIEPVEIRGDVAVIGGRAFPKRTGELRAKLEERIRRQGFEQVMETIAYTWFNRFVALRYMELHNYLEHGYRVLSNRSGSDIPEILEHAAEVELAGLNREKIVELRLAGDKDNELYRMLLVAQCTALHKAMPFLFGRIDDLTELLLPDNLLHSQSPIRKLVHSIDEAAWQEVEIIGWIYQFYISEKKGEVIGQVVKSEDIPAATQLFTPKWIVQYMVQNTLGRKWLTTYPDSKLREKMEYYIEPAEQTEEVKAQLAAIAPSELDPESITLLDPACGSGHILVEAYDIFKEIYLERGYRTKEIPRLILEKNLYGLEICERAAQLACFALLMKARGDDRHILASGNPVQLNIIAIQESKELDLDQVARVLLQERVISIGSSMPQQQHLFQPRAVQTTLSKTEKPEVSREQLSSLLKLYKETKTFGSLLVVPDELKEALPKFKTLLAKAVDWDAQSGIIAAMLFPLVTQTELLSQRYDLVVTNPPYMGGGGHNPQLKEFLKANYTDVKSDLFSAFIMRNTEFAFPKGQLGFVVPYVWMFISSYEGLRAYISDNCTITSLIQLEYNAFEPACIPVCAFTLTNTPNPVSRGSYIRLSNFRGSENQAPKTLEAIKNPDCGWLFRASAVDFKKIPGSPIAYWVTDKVRDIFSSSKSLSGAAETRQGLATGDNDKFLRLWFEVSHERIGFSSKDRQTAKQSMKKWFPCQKGGGFRRWYGNHNYVVEWANDGNAIRSFVDANGKLRSRPQNMDYYFREGLTWCSLSSSAFSMRLSPVGFISETKGSMCFPRNNDHLMYLLAFGNSKLVDQFLGAMSPTLDYHEGPCCPAHYFDKNGHF